MLDLGRTFLASAERSPGAEAIVDGARRLDYRAWAREVGALARGLVRLGLVRGDRLVIVLQNRIEMAHLHWACQMAGIVATPLNWRAKADEVDFCLADAEAKAVVFEPVSADSVEGARASAKLPRIGVGGAIGTTAFEELLADAADLAPAAGPEDFSLMLYTSGTTGRP